MTDETGNPPYFGGSVRMDLSAPGATTGYFSFMGRAFTTPIDLTVLHSPTSGDTRAAEDADLMHLWFGSRTRRC
jgi:hypothetical protein